MVKELKYPIFVLCLKFIEDDFWKKIFEDLSYGISPQQGVYIYGNSIIFNNKKIKKNIPLTFLSKEDLELKTKKLIKLFTKSEFLSENNRLLKKNRFVKNNIILNDDVEWKNIKKKMVKNILLEKYVLEKKKKFSMSNDKCKKLLSLINISMLLKIISDTNIIFRGGKIIKIKGINFSKDDFYLEGSYIKNISNDVLYEIPDVEKKYFSKDWENFIESLK